MSKVQTFILQTVGGVVFAFAFSMIIINWLSGCGEQFPTANGGFIQGECIAPHELFLGGE